VTGSPITTTGITFEWESGPSATGPWTLISGATAATFNASPGICSTVFYRRRTICARVGLSDVSTAVAVSTRCALLPPYFETFESITAVNQYPNCMTTDGKTETRIAPTGTWNQINRTPGGTKYASFFWGANNYLFTPAIMLTAGETYEFSFWYITDGAAGWDSLAVDYGTAPNAASMTNRLAPRLTALTNTTYRRYALFRRTIFRHQMREQSTTQQIDGRRHCPATCAFVRGQAGYRYAVLFLITYLRHG
jgi:hypothetical protein